MRNGKNVTYKDKKGLWRWRIVASNGRILADSGEGYSSRAACEKGLALVLCHAIDWPRVTCG